MKWSPQQDVALASVKKWLRARGGPQVFRLFGYAGVGKTTIAHETQNMVEDVLYASFTGKAALVMRRKGCEGARTIHSLIYVPIDEGGGEVSFALNPDSEAASADVIVVDEVSMVNPELGKDLLSFGTKVLVLGDPAQLPPIDGAGFFTKDAPDVMLTEIHRQAADNPIIAMATKVRNRERLAVGEYGPSRVMRREEMTSDMLMSADQVIVGTHVTRRGVNAKMRKIKFAQMFPDLERLPKTPVDGDRLVCLKNNRKRGLLNGSLWDAIDVKTPHKRDKSVTRALVETADDDTGRQIDIGVPNEFFMGDDAAIKALPWPKRKALEEFDFGYALTCHKCVHPDTLTETTEGLLPISSINRRHGTIATGITKALPYLNWIENPIGPALAISCEDGYAVTVTPDHKVEVFRDGNQNEIEARFVRHGDWMRVRLGVGVNPHALPPLPPPPSTHARARKIIFPKRMSRDMAEFLGLMVADGTVWHSGFRLMKYHADVAARFSALAVDLFGGLKSRRLEYNNAVGYEFNSTSASTWLLSIGGLGPKAKAVPDCVLRSNVQVHAAFLRGLFEDGGVNIKKGKCDHIQFSTNNRRIAEIVQTMLLRLGIISSRVKRCRQWAIYISGRQAAIFAEKVGFVSSFKNRRLLNCIDTERRYRVPLSLSEFDQIKVVRGSRVTIYDTQNFRTSGYVSRQKLREWSPNNKKLDWHWIRVRFIKKTRCASMCVTVPACHRFLQNGFPHGNSQGSQWDDVLVLDQSGVFREHPERWLYTAITRAAERIVVVKPSEERR